MGITGRLNGRPPTNTNSRYHSGQYLFFTTFNTEYVVVKERRPHHDE